jgi:hypothetical protein
VLAVLGAAVILVVGLDAVAYATTGKAFLLSAVNKATKTTTLQNTGAGAALNLLTKSTASAPFTTNAKGKVANLNADRVGGMSAAQLQAASAAVGTINFARTNAAPAAYSDPAVMANFPYSVSSKEGAVSQVYSFSGTASFACDLAADQSSTYQVRLYVVANGVANQVAATPAMPATSCGGPVTSLPVATAALMSNQKLLVIVDVENTIGGMPAMPWVTFSITGSPIASAL